MKGVVHVLHHRCFKSQLLRPLLPCSCRLGDLPTQRHTAVSTAELSQQQSQPQQQQQALQQQAWHGLQQSQQQQQQQEQQQEQDSPRVGTIEMAEALGRLCQAATKKQHLAHARRDAGAGKHASASSSGSSTPSHASSSKSRRRKDAHSSADVSVGAAGTSGRSTPSRLSPSRPSGSQATTSRALSAAAMAANEADPTETKAQIGVPHCSIEEGVVRAEFAAPANTEQMLDAFMQLEAQARHASPSAERPAAMTDRGTDSLHHALPDGLHHSQTPHATANAATASVAVKTASGGHADHTSVGDTFAGSSSASVPAAGSDTVQAAAASSALTGQGHQQASPAVMMLHQLHSVAARPSITSSAQAASRSSGATEASAPMVQAELAAADAVPQEANSVSMDTGTTTDAVRQEASSDSRQGQTNADVVPQEASSDSMHSRTTTDVVPQEASSESVPDQTTTDVVPQEASSVSMHSRMTTDVVPQDASSDSMHSRTTTGAVPQEASSNVVHSQTSPEQEVDPADTGLATHSEQEPAVLEQHQVGLEDSSTGSAVAPLSEDDLGGTGEVTPPAKGMQSALDRVQSLTVAEMQSPNKSKYARSESRQAGVRMADHPVGELCPLCVCIVPNRPTTL